MLFLLLLKAVEKPPAAADARGTLLFLFLLLLELSSGDFSLILLFILSLASLIYWALSVSFSLPRLISAVGYLSVILAFVLSMVLLRSMFCLVLLTEPMGPFSFTRSLMGDSLLSSEKILSRLKTSGFL